MKMYGGYIWRGANCVGLRLQKPPGKAPGNESRGTVASGAAVGEMEEDWSASLVLSCSDCDAL